MKQFYVICLVFICIIGLIFYSKDDTQPVFKNGENKYYMYELTFENKELSTLNFATYFENYQVISIYPMIPQLYQNRVTILKKYIFSSQSVHKNISQFEQNYSRVLEENGYRKEALKIKISGIFIYKVIVYTDEPKIAILKQEFPNMIINRDEN